MEKSKKRKLTHDDYKVGWICALPCEMAAALAMLDTRSEPESALPRVLGMDRRAADLVANTA